MLGWKRCFCFIPNWLWQEFNNGGDDSGSSSNSIKSVCRFFQAQHEFFFCCFLRLSTWLPKASTVSALKLQYSYVDEKTSADSLLTLLWIVRVTCRIRVNYPFKSEQDYNSLWCQSLSLLTQVFRIRRLKCAAHTCIHSCLEEGRMTEGSQIKWFLQRSGIVDFFFSLFYLKHFSHLSPNSDIRWVVTIHLFESHDYFWQEFR